MVNKFNRRSVLRLVGASSAITMSGIAMGDTSEDREKQSDDKHNLPFDVGVSNFSSKRQKLSLKILSLSGDRVIYSKEINLASPKGKGKGSKFRELQIPIKDAESGYHKLQATLNGNTKETQLLIEDRKFPSFIMASILIYPGGELHVASSIS